MKWTKNELLISYGYFKENGTSQSTSDFTKILEIFRLEQNREYSNAKNTFVLKLMNFKGYHNDNISLAGGLFKNKLFREVILSNDNEIVMREYHELIKDIDNIIVEKNVKDFISKSNEDHDIDIYDEKMFLKTNACVSYGTMNLEKYLDDIKEDKYKVPLFQRKFVWSAKEIISFLNALNNGYPFGNITIWKTIGNDKDILTERNKIVKQYKNDIVNNNDFVYWILDGQQRTTTIVSLLVDTKGSRKTKNIIYSFADGTFKKLEKDDINYIRVKDLFNKDFKTKKLQKTYGMTINDASFVSEELRYKFLNMPIGVTKVEKATLDTAIDIFTEMNTTGKRLSLFDIIHAKWQSPAINYDLENFIEKWLSNKNRVYKPDALTIAKSMYLSFDKNNIKSKDIMKFSVTPNIIENIEQTKKSLNLAHDYLVNELKFKGELMPSSNLIKFLTYAFSKNKNKSFANDHNKMIKGYIKDICLQNFYSSGTDEKLKQNIKFIDSVLDGERTYIQDKVSLVNKDILNMSYNEGSSSYLYVINVLFKYAKSLSNNTEIPVYASNEKSSSINIHHIIPKSLSFGGAKVVDLDYGNSVANLAPILEDENKNISNKYPSVYYKEYKVKNTDLDSTLNGLLIDKDILSEIDNTALERSLNSFWKDRASKIVKLVNNN